MTFHYTVSNLCLQAGVGQGASGSAQKNQCEQVVYGMNKLDPVQACSSLPTCAEKQKDLHGEELVVG